MMRWVVIEDVDPDGDAVVAIGFNTLEGAEAFITAKPNRKLRSPQTIVTWVQYDKLTVREND